MWAQGESTGLGGVIKDVEGGAREEVGTSGHWEVTGKESVDARTGENPQEECGGKQTKAWEKRHDVSVGSRTWGLGGAEKGGT